MIDRCFAESSDDGTLALQPVETRRFASWLSGQQDHVKHWLESAGFRAARDTFCIVPGRDGRPSMAVAGITSSDDPWCLGTLPVALPSGSYRLDADWPPQQKTRASIGWGLGAYQFTRYKQASKSPARLVLDAACDAHAIDNHVRSLSLVRDLINTPAEDMMPAQLADAVLGVATGFGATVTQIAGDELLDANYPAIHAVGRASTHAPRLIDLRWGDPAHPRLTLVGKGVCFDSGGLDLKSAKGMRLMKKDMGGAAHAIGLARLVMSDSLAVRLRLLVPAVDNAVAGNAYRPGDIIRTRAGINVEIDNTDAEGRVVLCDALAEGCREAPELLLDFATLTGAARVALGTELPALFCNRDEIADGLLGAARAAGDPVWRLPLHTPYRDLLDSKAADIVNAASSPYGGAITAALFLEEFVDESVPWAHFDVMAWNVRNRPGRPEGGEAMGLISSFEYLRARFAA